MDLEDYEEVLSKTRIIESNLKQAISNIAPVVVKVAKQFIDIWEAVKKDLGAIYYCKLSIEREKRKKYEKHLKRVENRQKLYEKRKALGKVK